MSKLDDCFQSNRRIMNRGELMIPMDLVLEIFSRLCAKSIARCRCVSKFWTSILSRPDFKEVFVTKSSTRPRLLFGLERPDGELHFYSSPQPKNLYKKSSSHSHIPSADFHMKFYVDEYPDICGPVSGLMYLPNVRISKEEEDTVPVICNLSTGKYVRLPHPGDMGVSFLGYDPIEKQFKVLFISISDEEIHDQILTLGSENVSWRRIEVPLPHFPPGGMIYINGVVYYIGYHDNVNIVCFDFRSETFMVLDKNFSYDDDLPMKLINYKGKLGAINWLWRVNPHEKYNLEMSLFVLEDVEKQEWSKHVYTLWNHTDACFRVSVVGVTTTSEVVLSRDYISHPFHVFYFHLENNSLQSIQIRGFGANLEAFEDRTRVYTSIDYVQDLKFI